MSGVTFVGGAWFPISVGTFAVTWPFARLSINDNSANLSARGTLGTIAKALTFEPSTAVIKRNRFIPFLADGISIATDSSERPAMFWSFEAERVVTELEARGFRVQ